MLLRPTSLTYVGLIQKLVADFGALRNRADVASLLEVSEDDLIRLLYWLPNSRRYREFSVNKRSGGVRQISAPCRQLAELQEKLAFILSLVFRPRPSAHGFIAGRSILTNAVNHTEKRYVLNIDLADFFPSINFGRIRGLFMSQSIGLHADAATILAQICSHNGFLPQGAPTSPIVSNMICMRIDGTLQKLAERSRCTYTRYADDITFSTSQRLFPRTVASPVHDSWAHNDVKLSSDLVNIIESNGFKVNASKVRMQFRNHHQEVTGLTVNQSPNVSRRYVRQIRAMLHAWRKFGHDNAQSEFFSKYDRRSRNPNLNRPEFRDVVRGKLAYLKMVKGRNDRVYLNLVQRARELDPTIARQPQVTLEPVEEIPDGDVVWSMLAKSYSALIFMVEVKVVVAGEETISCGTAFSFGPDEIATCAHVIEKGDISIYFSDTPTNVSRDDFRFHERGATVIDAAKMKSATLPVKGYIPIRPASEPLQIGEQVIVFGYPRLPGAQPKLCVSDGVVRTVTTDYAGTVEMPFLTNIVPPGMSGGPVIDRRGRVVGIAMENGLEETIGGPPPVPMPRVVAARHLLEIV